MSDQLIDKTPIRARHIRPGQGQAVEVKTGQFLQIQTLQGKQVADFVAFTRGDTDEYVSTSATRATNSNIIPQLGMTLYSNRRQPMFEIVEDTVGRHDMLYACCDPVRYELLGAPGHASCREALVDALGDYGIGYDRIPSPINWFMNVSIMQRGELEVREPLAEPGDYIVLRALKDVVAAVSACPQDLGPTNAFNPTDLTIRVYRDAPLPLTPEMVGRPAVVDEPAATAVGSTEESMDSPTAPDAAPPESPAERRAARRAERQAAAANKTPEGEMPVEVGEDPIVATESAPDPAGADVHVQDTAEATIDRVENGAGGGAT